MPTITMLKKGKDVHSVQKVIVRRQTEFCFWQANGNGQLCSYKCFTNATMLCEIQNWKKKELTVQLKNDIAFQKLGWLEQICMILSYATETTGLKYNLFTKSFMLAQ